MNFDEFWNGFDPHGTKNQELFKGHNYETGKSVWNAAIEEAAKVAEAQMSEPECPERAQYCADAIRALSSNAAVHRRGPDSNE